jgi:hypothetical protein
MGDGGSTKASTLQGDAILRAEESLLITDQEAPRKKWAKLCVAGPQLAGQVGQAGVRTPDRGGPASGGARGPGGQVKQAARLRETGAAPIWPSEAIKP